MATDWNEKIPPAGKVLGILAAIGVGGWILLTFISMGIESFGITQRRFPTVIMGFVTLGIIGLAVSLMKGAKKD